MILLGADKKQAAILRRYCEGLLQTSLLARENDVRLVCGRSAIAVLGSECCHWKTDEHVASSDDEVVGAAEPSMAMCPDGGLLLLGSSVYRKRGYMFRIFKKLHGNDDSEDVVWFAPSSVMNPKLQQRVVDRALAEDAPKARAEYLNIWREDLSDVVPLRWSRAAPISVFTSGHRSPALHTPRFAMPLAAPVRIRSPSPWRITTRRTKR